MQLQQKITIDPEKFKKQLQARKRESFHIENGDNLHILRRLSQNQFDSMVTDPPAGISFMGKDWDSDKGSRDQWILWLATTMAEAMRVLKPGAHALVWAIPRTQHWTMMALENAGFQVRDVVYHMFGQGFPKSHNISKAIDEKFGAEREVIGKRKVPDQRGGQINSEATIRNGGVRTIEVSVTAPATPEAQKWNGWGTALKPAVEAWILVQKPLSEKTVAANVLKHGTGGLNIDGTRIGNGGGTKRASQEKEKTVTGWTTGHEIVELNAGRFPANVIFDEAAAEVLDLQAPDCGAQAPVRKKVTPSTTNTDNFKKHTSVGDDGKSFRGDSGGASRFFYVAKASKSDRGEGNTHPTVKPIKLMEYLIKLVTPEGGTVLDPFMGSGTTGVAALKNGFKFFGIDQDKRYTEIALKRLLAVYNIDPLIIKKFNATTAP